MKQIVDVKEIQEILFENLKFFKKVCQKHNLVFFLTNGTLLGAVKYKKFIPWDDDVDVFMPREDYNKLMKISDFDNSIYELMSKERNSDWKVPYAKLKDTRTVLKETTADFGVENGVSIDIFPLDNWNGNFSQSIVQAKYCGLLRRFLTASMEKEFTSPQVGIKRLILFIIWKYSHFRGSDIFFKKIVNEINRGKNNIDAEFKGCIAWSLYGKKEVLPASIFKEIIMVSFEGEEFPAPIGFEIYLQKIYGNYWEELPKEKQKSHHDIMVWWKDEC